MFIQDLRTKADCCLYGEGASDDCGRGCLCKRLGTDAKNASDLTKTNQYSIQPFLVWIGILFLSHNIVQPSLTLSRESS